MHAKVLAIAALAAAAVAVLATVPGAAGGSGATRSLDASTRFYVPGFEQDAKQQWAKLVSQGDRADADLLAAMESTSHAVWLTGGSPNDARVLAQKTVLRAEGKRQVPVLVLYNIPFRDCSQYSAGGAADTAGYEAWIDGVASGIGGHRAVVLLEPDGLGIIPFYKQFMGEPEESAGYEWCQPKDADGNPLPGADPASRFAQLRYAVERLEEDPGVSVYLDATHSNWLGAGDAADRLIKAGVDGAQGFFLNVSNYEPTSHLLKYGTWISKCIGITESVGWWHVGWCASQYYPASPGDFGTWHLTDEKYAEMDWAIQGVPLKHFVIDTSRNGRGPWTPPAGAYSGDPQTWCNPPGRGLGTPPTADTGNPLADAFLWVKIPGQSDGSCNRGIAGSTTDPEWGGIVDPPAGAWFPQQALELARLAEPPLQ